MRHQQLSISEATIKNLFFGDRNGEAGAEVQEADLLPDVLTKETFNCAPACNNITGAACAGTDTAVHAMMFPRTGFEFYNIGTQTILCPQLTATGLDISLDAATNDGIEVTQGITAYSREAHVVGVAAFYAKLTFTIAAVLNAGELAFGFRKAEAYQSAIGSYDEMAVFNIQEGVFNIETIINGVGPTTVDTTEDDWVNGAEHTLEVYVSAGGVVTFKIDGVAPTVTATFTFDTDEVVIPFCHLLHDANVTIGAVLSEWEVGLQP